MEGYSDRPGCGDEADDRKPARRTALFGLPVAHPSGNGSRQSNCTLRAKHPPITMPIGLSQRSGWASSCEVGQMRLPRRVRRCNGSSAGRKLTLVPDPAWQGLARGLVSASAVLSSALGPAGGQAGKGGSRPAGPESAMDSVAGSCERIKRVSDMPVAQRVSFFTG
jgi:hypothetical protein